MKEAEAFFYLQHVLRAKKLRSYFGALNHISGKPNVHVHLVEQIYFLWEDVCQHLEVDASDTLSVFAALQKEVRFMNAALYRFFGKPVLNSSASWESVFSKVFSQLTSSLLSGWFLKEEVARSLLRVHPPRRIMRFLGYRSVDTLLEGENVFEIMASLRFGESKDWMYSFFAQYKRLKPNDFEHRRIVGFVFNPEKWHALDATFAHKKFHPLSHLKEFGVVFLVPSSARQPTVLLSKIIGLLLHYVYEIHFYSELFQRAASEHGKNFSNVLIMLLKGDIQKRKLRSTWQLRIIHQYHLKEVHPDPVAFEPHIHPEVLHWQKSLEQIIRWAHRTDTTHDFSFWRKVDFVAMNVRGQLVSMNFSDVAIDTNSIKTYHVHEALWNELFRVYFGSSSVRRALLRGFADGYVDLRQFVEYVKTKISE